VLTPSLDSAKSLAHLHAMVVIEELCRCGVEVFCLSPGARAIPLVLALEDQPMATTKLFNDERSAAFWAQGTAKGGVLPCLICTSGTAAANYLPAVAEAALSGTPMLILTTDRPFELHYAKANQTLPQHDLFAPFVQAVFETPAPEQQLFLHSLVTSAMAAAPRSIVTGAAPLTLKLNCLAVVAEFNKLFGTGPVLE
jgi:2-succinyl-5-enolpyruvyl-6-hydroxy-3-cyclohexene-1-carboxylate synthase